MTTQSSPSLPPAWRVEHGDCMTLLDGIDHGSVDAVVTDPPYGIDFQHAAWDGRAIDATATRLEGRRLAPSQAFEVFSREWAQRCLRVLKPGGHLVAFGAPRTAHRLACALEDAGFQLRDTLMWLYGEGLPKSRRLPEGRGTTLKPAYEPILLARKPPQGTVARNVREHGTGALEIDACRVRDHCGSRRWPANVVASHARRCTEGTCAAGCAVATLDECAGRPVSRFFYCPKARHAERDAGCEMLPARARDLFPNAGAAGKPAPRLRNPHPTVKPIELMRWLVRLACPPGGLVLDCFCGSGTSGVAAVLEHRRFLGIEREAEYVAIARARIAHWQRDGAASRASRREVPARPFARTRTARR
jgi:site-specific DNA-methyltransferase (adenine-specific)